MRGEIVCLDIEATGLDLQNDKIIEVAAVRFNGTEILDEFHTLIDPSTPIPSRITILTGISDDDVTGKPTIKHISHKLINFIGDAPLLGHKVSYDVGYLRPHGIAVYNPHIDTYELASFLLPTAARYSLTSLVEELELSNLNAHRALDDVMATIELYHTLWQKLLDLPFNLLREISAAAASLDWGAKLPLVEALRIRSKTALNDPAAKPTITFTPSHQDEWDALEINRTLKPIDEDSVAEYIEPDGHMAQHIPNYESRPSQVKMLRRVASAFNNKHHLMVEAPTGTGKSLAYLIPSIAWSILNNARVVVSTATIALQDQIMKHDLPLLQETLGMDFTAAVAKGRNNYLCPRQLESMRRRLPNTVEELRVMAKVLVWLQQSTTGDKAEINLRGFIEDMAWRKLSAQDEGCSLNRCEKQMKGACPFYKARRKAEAAHIVVANHALLLSDVNRSSRVLPDYKYLVIDEGHHLEDATTRGLQVKIDSTTLKRRFADLGSSQTGIFAELLRHLKSILTDTVYQQASRYVERGSEALEKFDTAINDLFQAVSDFLHSSGQVQANGYSSSIRIIPQLRNEPGWEKVVSKWETLHKKFSTLLDNASELLDIMMQLDKEALNVKNGHDYINTLQATTRDLKEAIEQLYTFIKEPTENTIYWCDVSASSSHISLNSAPLHVGPLLQRHLWEAKETVILTSATIRTENSFAFIRERLSAQRNEVDEFDVPSPFNYEDSTLIFIPTDIPEPNDRYNYQTMLERSLIEVASVTQGRMLGLFTSYVQLQQTAQNISPRLALGGINVLDQASGSSRQLLVDSFKSLDKAVLLGTRSFWEGIDLPGDDLQVLAIARLPFSVPSDPIFAARSETFENSFLQYSVPDAILRFRQGFGRLIRRRTDRGVVAIFDKRVISKRYGQHFLQSLPKCTVMRAPLARLPEATRRWLDR